MLFTTPVLFLIFNRPDTTQLVFESIRSVKPKYLYVAADGPRLNKDGENELCEYVRNIVLENIDWDCEVKTLFRDTNLGCGLAVSEAITWFFDNVEDGIILEDDCLPDISFFYFCSKLLDFYRFDDNVAMISGFNTFYSDDSYYFHTLASIWGWATWRRSWVFYNYKLNKENLVVFDSVEDKIIRKFLVDTFLGQIESKHSTWDIQWVYSILKRKSLSISPTKNLIKNIGVVGSHANGELSLVQQLESSKINISQFYKKSISFDREHSNLYIDFLVKNIKNDNKEFVLVTYYNLLKRFVRNFIIKK